MHILNLNRPLTFGSWGRLAEGRYFVEDTNAAEILARADRGSALLDFRVNLPDFDAADDWNGRRILFLRSGGFGDMLFLTPIIREIKRRWPSCHVAVCCSVERFAVFHGLGYPDAQIDPPLPVHVASDYHAVVGFEHVIEREGELHYVDTLAASMGLPLPDTMDAKRCDYRMTDDEREWATKTYPKIEGVPRLCVQIRSGAPQRAYPGDLLNEACGLLHGKGWEIVMLGTKGDALLAGDIPRVRNLCDAGLMFRQSCAVLATADVVLAPDSSLLHVAGALGLPAVGLFGPIGSRTRVAYSPTIFAIDGKQRCAPCNYHQRLAGEWPEGERCAVTKRCEALCEIKPSRVADEVMRARKRGRV